MSISKPKFSAKACLAKPSFLLGGAALVIVATVTWLKWPNQDAHPVPATPTAASAPVALSDSESPVSLSIDPALLNLRQAYRSPSTLARRIRLQGKLDKMWGGGPDLLPVEMLLGQVSDTQAPREYRVYVAKLLRNAAKRSTDSAFRTSIASGLRKAVLAKKDEAKVRAELTMALIDTDPGPESVTVIAPLLREISDADAQIAASALARSANPESKKALWQFVRNHGANSKTHPLTLGTALLPLCYEASLPMEPILANLLRTSDDETLLGMILLGVNARSESQQIASALVSVGNRKLSSVGPDSPFLRQLRGALRKQKTAMDANPDHFDKATTGEIQRLLQNT